MTGTRAPAAVPEIVGAHDGATVPPAEADLTITQASEFAGVGPSTIRRRLAEQGHPDLPRAYKDVSGRWFIPVGDLRVAFPAGDPVPDVPAPTTDEAARPAADRRSAPGTESAEAGGRLADALQRAGIAEFAAAQARRELAERLADKDAQIAQVTADSAALLRRADQALAAKDEAIIAKDDTVTALVGALADRDDRILSLEREIRALRAEPTAGYVQGTVVNGPRAGRGRPSGSVSKPPRRTLWEWLIGIEPSN